MRAHPASRCAALLALLAVALLGSAAPALAATDDTCLSRDDQGNTYYYACGFGSAPIPPRAAEDPPGGDELFTPVPLPPATGALQLYPISVETLDPADSRCSGGHARVALSVSADPGSDVWFQTSTDSGSTWVAQAQLHLPASGFRGVVVSTGATATQFKVTDVEKAPFGTASAVVTLDPDGTTSPAVDPTDHPRDGSAPRSGVQFRAYCSVTSTLPYPTWPLRLLQVPASSVSGSLVAIVAEATPGHSVQLLAKQAPSSAFTVVRTATAGSTGRLRWSDLRPARNLVWSLHDVTSGETAQQTAATTVHVAVRAAVSQLAPRSWSFDGVVLPALAGQHVTLKLCSTGCSYYAATTDSRGAWRVEHRFAGTVRASWRVLAAATATNASGATPATTTTFS